MIPLPDLQRFRAYFGDRLQVNVPLKRFTAARIGGNADVLISVNSSNQLAEAARVLWESSMHFTILGSGSNILVSDAGVRQVVILNQAKAIHFHQQNVPPIASVESGANLGNLARRAAALGLSGLEWAAGIPGTVGGAIYGNAGAHDGDMSGSLLVANILQRTDVMNGSSHNILQENWSADRFEYAYRSSVLKRQPGEFVILSADLKLESTTTESVQLKMDEFRKLRKNSQPAGASLGSIFTNPADDYAGRLIEAAGLKGTKIGNVEISQKHANFFINHENATASDYAALIKLAQQKVYEKFGVNLELEVELIGDWSRTI